MTRIDRAAHRPPGTARARAGQTAGAPAIDLGVLAVPAVLTVVAASGGHGELAVLAALTALGVVIAQLRSWSRTGQTFGLALVGARHVTSVDGAPPGFARAMGATWIADVRRARDPLDPQSLVPLLPPAPRARPVDERPARESPTTAEAPSVVPPRPRTRALLVLDGRVGGSVGTGVVLGRNPTAAGDERAVPVADIGREISKAHLGVSVDDDGRAWATDRGSTNGSTLERADGSSERLLPGRSVELRPGDQVRIGSHTVAVQFVTDVSMGAR